MARCFLFIFWLPLHILEQLFILQKGGFPMFTHKPYADLDDWLFAEADDRPSDR